jgi:ligand-binding SRPBCC domain-containing protein
METVRMQTWIDAPIERCFLLSLSIDLHLASIRRTQKEAIDGVTTGLIGEGQSVTFRARHLGRWWLHTSRIEAMRPYSYFRDVMVAGAFRRFEHEHHFAPMDDGTRMRDEIQFSAPWGVPGQIFARRLLLQVMKERNFHIKQVAESEEWRNYLDASVEVRLPLPANGSVRRWEPNGLLRNSGIDGPPPPQG